MKKLLLIPIIILFISCQSKAQDCNSIKVGATYVIRSYPSKNPFEPQTKATVTIIAIKKGYVQYCWYYDYKRKNRELYSFNRTCEEFTELLNNKHQ